MHQSWTEACGIALIVAAATGCATVSDSGSGATSTPDISHLEQIETYRAERQERLERPGGWLTLVGLYWLEEGENPFGSDPSNPVALPPGAAPDLAGSFHYDGSEVRMVAAPGVDVFHGDLSVRECTLPADKMGHSAPLSVGRLALYVIKRGDRHAIRVKDPESPVRTGFRGLEFFPVDERYRVKAKFLAEASPGELKVPTVIGTDATYFAPGKIEFTLDGTTHTLQALTGDAEDNELFLIFKDETSGHETYAAGRFLYAEREGDEVVVDFNRAYNPPCVFTPYATCPLPPRGNTLAARIEAGEKGYGEY